MKALIDINILLDVAGLNRTELLNAIDNENFSDLEDSMQHESAVSSDIDYIVTRDSDDFANATVPAVTPIEFLEIAQADRLGL